MNKHPYYNEWASKEIEETPKHWPTVTGLPLNGGKHYWLFDQTRGFQANLPHGGFT